MIPAHPLDGAFERINRAEEHLIELKRQIDVFGQNYLESVGIYFDPNPPYHAYDRPPFKFPRPAPIVSILLGEICYNLRSALDYLVFELAYFDSGIIQQGTQFPIDDAPKKFAKHFAQRADRHPVGCRRFVAVVDYWIVNPLALIIGAHRSVSARIR
jgi:hypothetical protein